MENRVVLITQARVGSSRLPAKVLKKIKGKSILQIQLERVSKCEAINEIIVAIPYGEQELPIHEICNKLNINFSIGSENDVLDRFYNAALNSKADWVVRITSDCPIVDPELISDIVCRVITNNKDYGSNTLVETYPDGQDIEVFKFNALENAWKNAILNSDREHVTPYIKKNCETNHKSLFSSLSIENKVDYSDIRMTVDELNDFYAIELLITKLGTNATWTDYTKYILNNQEKFNNQNILRNEGYYRSLNND